MNNVKIINFLIPIFIFLIFFLGNFSIINTKEDITEFYDLWFLNNKYYDLSIGFLFFVFIFIIIYLF